jgi:putative membrane protein
MRTTFSASLLAACVLAAPAFAQTTTQPLPPAPAVGAVAPPQAAPYAPATPLTAADTHFVSAQLEGNLMEVKAGQLALQDSRDQDIRNFAQKMITDHTAAIETLTPIAQRHGIQVPTVLTPMQQGVLDRMSKLSGLQFDRSYMDAMVRSHDRTLKQLDDQLIHGQSQEINAWVQNTRPVVLQHIRIAQQIKANLPRTTG